MAYTTIDKPDDYFNTKLYTGTGSSQSVTGVGFSPSMSWFKQRNTTRGHVLEDIVRGAGNTLFPHDTSSETAGGFYLTSFDSDGFTLPSSNVGTNESGGTYASWNWLANGAGVSNTDGTITSTVSANTTSGFSIVNFVGTQVNATVGHGLGLAPKMIIVKNRDRAGGGQWWVFHASLGATKSLNLNATDAEQTVSVIWNNTAPTSSVFSVGTGDEVNGSGDNIIAYCFAEKKGFSKFGSYTGTGGGSGLIDTAPFIYTGFKPAFYIWKRSDVANDWYLLDNKRDPFNLSDLALFPNLSAAESDGGGSFNGVDFLSNGIKIRTGNTSINASGGTFIYMAFAESPFTTSTGIPTTAR